MVLVFNGVEEADFTISERRFSSFTFVHVGTLHPFQFDQLALFLRALAAGSGRDQALKLARVVIAGHRPPAFDSDLMDLAGSLGIRDRIDLHTSIAHSEAVALMKGANVLLLFDGGTPFTRLSKVSEYAAAQRPVLGLTVEGGENARNLRELGQVAYCGTSHEDLAQILIARSEWRTAPSEHRAFPFPFPHPLNWKTAAKQLAEHLDVVSAAPSKVRG
jgi:hypothetical protein